MEKITELEFKTFEQMAIEKLTEIEPATRQQWALAMGYNTRNSMQYVANRCVKNNLVIVDKTKKPYMYRINIITTNNGFKKGIKNGKKN